MDLAKELGSTQTEAPVSVRAPRTAGVLPVNEVQEQIKRVCFEGMHYDNLWTAIGKLASGGIVPEVLQQNVEYFNQFIAEDSATMQSQTVSDIIDRYEKYYADQVGSRPFKNLAADCFSKRVYASLPEKLRVILLLIEDPRKRDVCLIGILTALSAAFARFRFFHGSDSDVKEYSPHILSLVLGAAGSGKGLTRYGGMLVEAISKKAVDMRKEALANYRKQKDAYDRERRTREKEKASIEDLIEPTRPPKYAFAMSASDTTQAALVEILNENPTGGFAYDSEVDTMVQANGKKDFGGFSDVTRKVFHHEPLARQRKGENESYIVQSPRLAIMLSGTHDQLKKLITSETNGLFSRLWYYSIPPVFMEYKIGREQRDVVGEMCYALQQEVFDKADLWSDELIYLQFSEEQEQQLYEAMKDKKHIEEIHGGDIGASWIRLPLIIKRIAVTLAGFEGCGSGIVPPRCWEAAIELLPALKSHCLRSLDIVRSNQGKLDISKEEYLKMKESGLTDQEIADKMKVARVTIARRKKEWEM